MAITAKKKPETEILVKLGRDAEFVPPDGHPYADLTKRERRYKFLNLSGEIWARLCREEGIDPPMSGKSGQKKA